MIATSKHITTKQFHGLLRFLGLKETRIPEKLCVAFHDDETDLLILLADKDENSFARLVDLASARKHLVDLGYMDTSEFEEFLTTGKLPNPIA